MCYKSISKTHNGNFILSKSRNFSRLMGYFAYFPLPPYFRKYLYLLFGKVYGVNFNEMYEEDRKNLNKFKNFS